MRFAAVFAIVVGVGMMGWWGVSIAGGQVPELQTEPYRIAFHLAGEFMTAAALTAGGWGLLSGRGWARRVYLVASGMLLYTAVVSPGYFAQRGEWPLVGMFAALVILTLAGVGFVWRQPPAA